MAGQINDTLRELGFYEKGTCACDGVRTNRWWGHGYEVRYRWFSRSGVNMFKLLKRNKIIIDWQNVENLKSTLALHIQTEQKS